MALRPAEGVRKATENAPVGATLAVVREDNIPIIRIFV